MKSLFSQLALAFAAVIAGMTIIIALAFFGGARMSFRDWQSGRDEDLEATVGERLQDLVDSTADPDGTVVARTLSPVLGEDSIAVVYDRDGRLVYAHRADRSWTVTPPAQSLPGRMMERMGPGFAMRSPRDADPLEVAPLIDPRRAPAMGLRPVTPADARTPALFYRAENLGFLEDAGNRALFGRMVVALIAGVLLSGAAGVSLALATSTRVGRQTQALASALNELSHGRRDLSFPRTGPRELRTIAAGAEGLQQRLSRDERARTQWTQDIAHDLRTPVSAMRAQLEAMIDGVLTADGPHLKRLLSELDRMQRLVTDLGRLTRLESPDFRLETTTISSESFLADIQNRFELTARNSGHQVQISAQPKSFVGDRELLLRAMSNLVDNAIKYGDPGSIEVTVTETDRTVVFAVANPGNLPDEPERLFDRLVRAEYAGSAGGSGLGLTIVRTIAEVHGGTARLSAAPTASGRYWTIARIEIPKELP